MSITTDLQKYFTPKMVGQILEDFEPVRTPIWARVFSKVKQHPLGYITKQTIIDHVGNVPLTKRGTPSIGVFSGDETSDLFEPQPIAINTVIKAKDFLDLKTLGTESSLQNWVAEKLSGLRDRVYSTIEAMCCQALTGTIDYAIKIYEGDLGTYRVKFGDLIQPASYVGFVGNWASATLDEIFKDILILKNAIKLKTRYGSKIGILAGRNAYFTLMAKMKDVNTSTAINLKIEGDYLHLNGTIIEYMGDAGYTNLKTALWTPAIGDDEIVLFAEDAPFNLTYLAIDDFDAMENPVMIARPLYPKTIKQDDPSGYKILVQSKPFPMPVPMATIICSV